MSDQAEDPKTPPSPFAKYRGELQLGATPVDCYVLDTGDRVISLRATVKAITNTDGGVLADYIGVSALRKYIDKDKVQDGLIEFHIPGTQFVGKGIKAEDFLDICRAYVHAHASGALTTDRQRTIAINCGVLLASCSKVGLIALIDEATGYQYDRAEDALQLKLRAFIADELREWEKTFPDELWEQFGRLTKWNGPLHSRPKWWGKLVMELIYNAIDPEIAEHLRTNKPPPAHGRNYHQWLTQDIGLRTLISHINQVVGIAKTCRDMRELRDRVAEVYGSEPIQMTMWFPRKPGPKR